MTSHSESLDLLQAEIERMAKERQLLLDTVRWSHEFLTGTCGVVAWPLVDRLNEAISQVTGPPVEAVAPLG